MLFSPHNKMNRRDFLHEARSIAKRGVCRSRDIAGCGNIAKLRGIAKGVGNAVSSYHPIRPPCRRTGTSTATGRKTTVDGKFLFALILFGALTALPHIAGAASGPETGRERITLPAPDKTGGKPLMQALALRASNRAFSPQAISNQDLSNLLWAAWGVNRQDGRRTVPTARNTQDAALFVARENGVWRYEGQTHQLVKVLDEDKRAGNFGGAPVVLVYAAKLGPHAGMHVGSMYQNAGLYCASAGLANVVRATGVSAFQGHLPLPPGYAVLIVQLVGLPR